jgi:hypothetical protein
MKTLHPNDRQLQQYLNRMCTETDFAKIRKHVKICTSCQIRLHTYLDMEKQLDQMPLLAVPTQMADRIMSSILAETHSSPDGSGRLKTTAPSSGSIGRWSPELVNGLIAVAATFLFVTSGIIGDILSINPDNWGADVQNKVAAIESVVTKISLQIIS